MLQFTQATTQSIANEPERIGMSQLTKQHRHELAPTSKASCMSFRFGLFDQSPKFGAGKMTKKLIKQTGGLYHVRALLLRPASHPPSHGSDAIQHSIGGHSSFHSNLKS
jgi:hypothetical protein